MGSCCWLRLQASRVHREPRPGPIVAPQPGAGSRAPGLGAASAAAGGLKPLRAARTHKLFEGGRDGEVHCEGHKARMLAGVGVRRPRVNRHVTVTRHLLMKPHDGVRRGVHHLVKALGVGGGRAWG